MSVPALRHAAPLSAAARQGIALDHRDGSIVIGEHPGNEEATHACAKNDCVLTDFRHVATHFSRAA
jgi:hypothetical protein